MGCLWSNKRDLWYIFYRWERERLRIGWEQEMLGYVGIDGLHEGPSIYQIRKE